MSRHIALLLTAVLVVGTTGTALAQPTADQPKTTEDQPKTPEEQPKTTEEPPTATEDVEDAGDNKPTGTPTAATDNAPTPPSTVDKAPVTVMPPAKKDAPVGLRATASFFTRYELRENYADVGRTAGRFSEFDAFVYRARLGLATTPVDIGDGQTVKLRFVPQVYGFWGDRPGTLGDGPLFVHEAVMRLAKDKFWLDVGRFEMVYGDHFVIGNVVWHEAARAFDGARVHLPIGGNGAWLEAFATQVGEGLRNGLTSTVGEGDQLFLGAYLALGPNISKGTALDAYVLSNVWLGNEQDVDPEITVGSRYKARSGNVDVRVEAGGQIGSRPNGMDVLAFQGEGEVGFHANQLRVAAGGFYASGDDPDTADTDESWNQLYPTAHKWLGWMDIIGARSNVMGGMAKLRYKVDKKLVFGAHGHFFMRPQTADGVDSYTGFEVDTFALKTLGKGLKARAGYHILLPNETGPLGTDTPVHYVELMFSFDLK